MVEMNEKKVIQMSLGASLFVLVAWALFLYSIRTPDFSRIPGQEIYSQGITLNFYANYVLPVVIVLAILFIGGLSTFGLYHGATRETLGKRPLIHRPLTYIRKKKNSGSLISKINLRSTLTFIRKRGKET